MSYEHGTPFLNLPQTVGSDKRDWFDTNEAFLNLDSTLKSTKETADTATSGLATTNANLTALTTRVTTAEGDIDNLESGLATTNENVSILGTTVNNISNTVTENKQDLKDAICAIEEESATATYRHEVGTFFWYNETLYKTTILIPIGEQIVPNINCSTTTVTVELLSGGGGTSVENVVRYDATNERFEYNDNGTWTPIPSGTVEASEVSFTDTIAQLGATDVQSAIVALKTLIDNIGGGNMPIYDFANPLHTFDTNNLSYTLSKDAYLVGSVSVDSGSVDITIDNTVVSTSNSYGVGSGFINVKVKAGSVITASKACPGLHVYDVI